MIQEGYDDMENILDFIIKKIYEITDVELGLNDLEMDLHECMDSIGFVRLIVDLEQEYNIEIPDSYLVLEEINTIKKIEQIVLNIINERE